MSVQKLLHEKFHLWVGRRQYRAAHRPRRRLWCCPQGPQTENAHVWWAYTMLKLLGKSAFFSWPFYVNLAQRWPAYHHFALWYDTFFLFLFFFFFFLSAYIWKPESPYRLRASSHCSTPGLGNSTRTWKKENQKIKEKVLKYYHTTKVCHLC